MDRPARRNIDSVRTESWKLYRNQLFNLEADPGEQWDAAVNNSAIIEGLRKKLDEAIASRKSFDEVPFAASDKTKDELRALGYLD